MTGQITGIVTGNGKGNETRTEIVHINIMTDGLMDERTEKNERDLEHHLSSTVASDLILHILNIKNHLRMFPNLLLKIVILRDKEKRKR